MDEGIRMFVLQKHSAQSHTYVGDLKPAPNTPGTVESLIETVRHYIKSRPELKSWGEDVDDINFAVHKLPRETRKLTKRRLLEKADSDGLNEETLVSTTVLDASRGPLELIFVFDSLQIRFVLLQTIGSSRKCIAVERATALLTQNVHIIKQAAQDCVKVHLGLTLEADRHLQVWEPRESFKLGDKLTARSNQDLCDLIDKEYMDNCSELRSDDALEDITCREHLIITFNPIYYNFVIFEQKSRSSYENFGSGSVVAFPEDLAQTIYNCARSRITTWLDAEDPSTVATIDSLRLYEPKDEYQERYKEVLETGRLEPDLVGRSSSVIRNVGDRLGIIKTPNLIFVFTATRPRPLRFSLVLFERKSESLEFAGHDCVDASSEQTVQAILDAVRRYIKLLPVHGTKTGHCIEVYKPTEAFEGAYGKTATDLESLKLEEQHLRASPAKCVLLSHQRALSDVDVGQTLIIVFSIPSPLPRSDPTLSDEFLRLKIVDEPPSRVSQPESYKALQNQSKQRNLDDRPHADLYLPPISLVYDGFGVFEDVRQGLPVPGEDDILEVQLWDKINAFADRMAQFYDSEAQRRAVVLDYLQEIFRARKDPNAAGERISASKIGARQIISDGHSNGAHDAIVFCIECKNELSNISCEPSAELVSYVASSFKEQLNGKHQALFHAWRVPALGMTQIGAFVQFFGIVMLTPQMRVVHLTPMLPLAAPIDDEQSRWNVFLAFKAASIVNAKLQADTRRLLQGTMPPEIPIELRVLPSVTKIRTLESAPESASASSSPSYIDFTLLGRHDQEVPHRNLYRARLDSTNEEIYVKFVQQYSPDLHIFCANKGLAPKLLGYERLTGGWFALAMEKVDIVKPRMIKSFSELKTWKEEIGQLVKDFHQQGLVHGDLRLANFIFTKNKNPRMLLVDFDWGGKVEEVFFPRGPLCGELMVENDRLRRPITREHDNRVLAETFAELDRLRAAAAKVGKTEPFGGDGMDVDPAEHAQEIAV